MTRAVEHLEKRVDIRKNAFRNKNDCRKMKMNADMACMSTSSTTSTHTKRKYSSTKPTQYHHVSKLHMFFCHNCAPNTLISPIPVITLMRVYM